MATQLEVARDRVAKKGNQKVQEASLAAPFVFITSAIFLLPLVLVLMSSFLAQPHAVGEASILSFTNYREFVSSVYMRELVWRTIFIGVIVTVATTVLSYPVSYYLSRSSGLVKRLLLVAVLVPLMTSAVVRSLGWIVLLNKDGLITKLFGVFGLETGSAGLMQSNTGLSIALIHVMLPLMVLLLYGTIDGLPSSLEDAARSLGRSPFGAFIRVILPLTIPGMASGAVLVFTLTISNFVTASLIGGSGLPVMATEIYDKAVVRANWPMAGVISILLLALAGIAGIIYASSLRRFNFTEKG